MKSNRSKSVPKVISLVVKTEFAFHRMMTISSVQSIFIFEIESALNLRVLVSETDNANE